MIALPEHWGRRRRDSDAGGACEFGNERHVDSGVVRGAGVHRNGAAEEIGGRGCGRRKWSTSTAFGTSHTALAPRVSRAPPNRQRLRRPSRGRARRERRRRSISRVQTARAANRRRRRTTMASRCSDQWRVRDVVDPEHRPHEPKLPSRSSHLRVGGARPRYGPRRRGRILMGLSTRRRPSDDTVLRRGSVGRHRVKYRRADRRWFDEQHPQTRDCGAGARR